MQTSYLDAFIESRKEHRLSGCTYDAGGNCTPRLSKRLKIENTQQLEVVLEDETTRLANSLWRQACQTKHKSSAIVNSISIESSVPFSPLDFDGYVPSGFLDAVAARENDQMHTSPNSSSPLSTIHHYTKPEKNLINAHENFEIKHLTLDLLKNSAKSNDNTAVSEYLVKDLIANHQLRHLMGLGTQTQKEALQTVCTSNTDFNANTPHKEREYHKKDKVTPGLTLFQNQKTLRNNKKTKELNHKSRKDFKYTKNNLNDDFCIPQETVNTKNKSCQNYINKLDKKKSIPSSDTTIFCSSLSDNLTYHSKHSRSSSHNNDITFDDDLFKDIETKSNRNCDMNSASNECLLSLESSPRFSTNDILDNNRFSSEKISSFSPPKLSLTLPSTPVYPCRTVHENPTSTNDNFRWCFDKEGVQSFKEFQKLVKREISSIDNELIEENKDKQLETMPTEPRKRNRSINLNSNTVNKKSINIVNKIGSYHIQNCLPQKIINSTFRPDASACIKYNMNENKNNTTNSSQNITKTNQLSSRYHIGENNLNQIKYSNHMNFFIPENAMKQNLKSNTINFEQCVSRKSINSQSRINNDVNLIQKQNLTHLNKLTNMYNSDHYIKKKESFKELTLQKNRVNMESTDKTILLQANKTTQTHHDSPNPLWNNNSSRIHVKAQVRQNSLSPRNSAFYHQDNNNNNISLCKPINTIQQSKSPRIMNDATYIQKNCYAKVIREPTTIYQQPNTKYTSIQTIPTSSKTMKICYEKNLRSNVTNNLKRNFESRMKILNCDIQKNNTNLHTNRTINFKPLHKNTTSNNMVYHNNKYTVDISQINPHPDNITLNPHISPPLSQMRSSHMLSSKYLYENYYCHQMHHSEVVDTKQYNHRDLLYKKQIDPLTTKFTKPAISPKNYFVRRPPITTAAFRHNN